MDIFEAADQGDLEVLDRLLADGVDPDVRDADLSADAARDLRRAVYQLGDLALAGRPLARTPLILAAA